MDTASFRLISFLLLLAVVPATHAAVPAELAAALKSFRADPPPGWSFTQTTSGEGKSTVEHCDAAKPEFERWSLVQKDGREPTADESREYAEARSRRSRGGTAPKLIEQLDLETLETLTTTGDRKTYRCRIKPGERGDTVGSFLRATIVLHTPSQTIESLELGSIGEFSPTFVVKIAEMKTAMSYSLPAADRPSLPQKVTTRVRGRAFLFKSLDEELTVTFSDYARVGKR